MSIYTISMTHLAEKHSEDVSAFDWHGEYNAKCPNCGGMMHMNRHDILNDLIGTGYTFCPYCGGRFLDPDPYSIVDYFNDNAPHCDDIIDCLTREYIGTRVHHVIPNQDEDKPHVWTDTAARRTYCEYRGEIVSVATKCDVLDHYMADCYRGPHW